MKPIYIDLRRINDEERAQRRIETYGDVDYRNRVKQRMMEGKACKHPPLYNPKHKEPAENVKMFKRA